MQTTSIESWVSVREASEVSGYGKEWIRELARNGEIKSMKMGFAVLIDRKSLKEYMEQNLKKE